MHVGIVFFPYHKDFSLRKELATGGSKFFPSTEVPIFKRDTVDEIPARFCSLPLICIVISALRLRYCHST